MAIKSSKTADYNNNVELKEARKKALLNLCESYPVLMSFVPTAPLLHKLILRATQLKNEQDILNQINPKEKKRVGDDNDLVKPQNELYCDLRIVPAQMDYPNAKIYNYPRFYEEISCEHLADKYKPDYFKKLEK